jgi:hypothetical protein
MSAAFTTSHVQRGPILPCRTVAATGGKACAEWLSEEVTRLLPGRGLGNLDVATLAKLLREAERIMANTNLLLRSVTDRASAARALSSARVTKCPKTLPKMARSR